ncbi:3848_t:CDS:1, partial [Diversispora eburnea]
MGKNISEKVEKVRKILKKEMAVVLVKTEVFKNNRMISALYDNEEEMVKGKQCDVGGNAGKPTYMHRAEIFRRNLVKELIHGVKLWDVPLGMKNKELKEDLENKYGEIERLTMRVNNMWQSAVAIFKEKEDVKKDMEKWSIIIGEDSLRVIQIDQTANNLKSRGEHATRIIGLPNGITARELWPHVEKIRARTCYIPRTRTYRRKNEAIISFEDYETCRNSLNVSWKFGEFNIRIVDIQTKMCHRCHATDHLVIECSQKLKDNEIKEKNVDRLDKFEPIYKRLNSRFYNIINKQIGNKTYAE